MSLILYGPYGRENREKYRSEEDLREGIATFFFQGNGASRLQGAIYAGPEGISVLTEKGEMRHTSCSGAPRLIHNVYTYPELSEVSYDWSLNPVHWGMWAVSAGRNLLVNTPGGSHHTDLRQMSVGGDADVGHHLKYSEEMFSKLKNKHKVLFGCSRGAATTLVSVSKMSRETQSEISLVIVEAPFDTIPSVLQESSWFPKTQLWGLKMIGSYRDDQTSPLQAIENFPLDVPVAFVTSKIDKRVPSQCTQRLIDRLGERGHKHLHHLELENSHHSVMSLQNHEDIQGYYKFVNKLYDLYC